MRFRSSIIIVRNSIIIILAGSALAACETLQIQSRVDPHTIAQYAPGAGVRSDRRGGPDLGTAGCPLVATGRDDHRGAINLDCFTFPEDRKPEPALPGQHAYAKAVGERTARNRLTSILIKQSDDICTTELSALRANEATVNTGLSTLTTSLSAAATVVSGELAKSILSGTAAAVSGTQSHINVQVYRNQISEAVAQAIEVDRDRQRDLILARYKDETDVWSVDDAVRMVNAYHGTCSFYKGLQLLLMKPGQEKVREAFEAERQKVFDALLEAVKRPGTPASDSAKSKAQEQPKGETPAKARAQK